MTKHRFTALLTAFVLCAGMTACDAKTDRNDTDTTVTSVTTSPEYTDKATKHEGYRLSEYDEIAEFDITDWKYEDVGNNIMIGESVLSIPCRKDALGPDFKIGEENKLYYRGDWIADVETEGDEITYLFIYTYTIVMYPVKLNDTVITDDLTLTGLEGIYGKQNMKEQFRKKGSLYYLFRNGAVYFYIDDGDDLHIGIGKMNYYIKEHSFEG